MELLELENLARKEKIDLVADTKMNRKAQIVNYDNTICIFMNYSKINTLTEEKCTLAEEMGHYYYGAYYSLNSNQTFIDRQEYKAMKWKSLACISPQSILRCFYKGIVNLYDIAKELCVEPTMVQFAYDYYRQKGLLYTDDEMLEKSI